MYITNIWGIWFCLMLPAILTVLGVYLEGIEEGKRRQKLKIKKQRRTK